MRKKYLSALLFGALLFATAGTFTSCKDYDDDINNLQEQINTVVSDLASLKSQIATQYVQSVTFNDETGELVVTTMANGSSSSQTYIVKTSAGAGEVSDVEIEIKDQNLVVNGEVIGKVGDTVAVNENGELTINGEDTGITVGKYTILTDKSQSTVTIQIPNANGELENVTLLTAAAALTSVQFQNDALENVFGGAIDNTIEYGVAGVDHTDWAGPKGAVARNQLLVGQISTIDVQVTPADYELDQQELTLQNSLGNTINVKVKATPNNMLLTRTASKSGSWTLSIEMNENVTVNNIANVFGGTDPVYTLCVNGKPFTTFEISGNVATAKQATAINLQNEVVDLKYVAGGTEHEISTTGGGETLPLGTTTDLTAVMDDKGGGSDNYFDYLYDSYITFEGTMAERAKTFEISANGMSITTGSKAAGVTITATVHTMSVTGNISTSTVEFKVANSAADAQTIATTSYTLAPARTVAELLQPMVIDLGDVFSQMDVATLEQVKQAGQLKLTGFGGEFLLAGTVDQLYGTAGTGAIADGKVALLKADNTNWSDNNFSVLQSGVTDLKNNVLSDGLLSLRYIKLDPTVIKLSKDAKPGKYNLTLSATDDPNANSANATNTILKVTIPVEIKVPAFSEMFAKNYTTDKFEARITPTTVGGATAWSGTTAGANAGLTLSTAFKIAGTTYNPDASKLAFAFETFKNGKYPVTNLDQAYNGEDHNAISGSQTVALLDKSLFYNDTQNGLVADTDMKNMVAYYSVLDIIGATDCAGSPTTYELEALKENFTVTSEAYTSTVKAALDGIKLAYYHNKAAQDLASYEVTLQTDGSIKPLTFDGDGNPVEGLALVFGDDIVPVGYTSGAIGYGYDNAIAGYYKIGVNSVATTKDVLSTAVISKSGATIAWNSQYEVTGLVSGESATVTITLTDASGIQYPLTLRVKK